MKHLAISLNANRLFQCSSSTRCVIVILFHVLCKRTEKKLWMCFLLHIWMCTLETLPCWRWNNFSKFWAAMTTSQAQKKHVVTTQIFQLMKNLRNLWKNNKNEQKHKHKVNGRKIVGYKKWGNFSTLNNKTMSSLFFVGAFLCALAWWISIWVKLFLETGKVAEKFLWGTYLHILYTKMTLGSYAKGAMFTENLLKKFSC
jgi:hypothetical protein